MDMKMPEVDGVQFLRNAQKEFPEARFLRRYIIKSRGRIRRTLSHIWPDKLAVNFGPTAVTGMHAAIV